MSNGDDERSDEAEDQPVSEAEDESGSEPEEETASAGDVEAFQSRLNDIEAALESAETEADLDDVEADLEAIETDIEETTFPVPEVDDEDDEEPDDPAEPLNSRVDDLREGVEAERGPYGEDVADRTDDAAGVIRGTRWTRDGEPDVVEAVAAFLDAAGDELNPAFESEGETPEDLAAAVESVGEVAADGRLDADADADTIAALLDTVDTLDSDLEAAEEWSDLEVVEQLRREGFYDRLESENRKDFPPELSVIRIAESENDPERILQALEAFDSDFMQENCLDALRRLGAEAAYEPVSQLAQRRDEDAIEVLGKIGDERAVDTLVDFLDGGTPPLQRATLRALGEIGSEEASQPIANAMAEEEPSVRSVAARALGMIGDTRAIDPLSNRLADESEADEVRASAAWALVQIGTERALEAAAEYDGDRVYTVQIEAEKAQNATAN
jgi:HEAT repeat protein